MHSLDGCRAADLVTRSAEVEGVPVAVLLLKDKPSRRRLTFVATNDQFPLTMGAQLRLLVRRCGRLLPYAGRAAQHRDPAKSNHLRALYGVAYCFTPFERVELHVVSVVRTRPARSTASIHQAMQYIAKSPIMSVPVTSQTIQKEILTCGAMGRCPEAIGEGFNTVRCMAKSNNA